jgi:hypothetical protein
LDRHLFDALPEPDPTFRLHADQDPTPSLQILENQSLFGFYFTAVPVYIV